MGMKNLKRTAFVKASILEIFTLNCISGEQDVLHLRGEHGHGEPTGPALAACDCKYLFEISFPTILLCRAIARRRGRTTQTVSPRDTTQP